MKKIERRFEIFKLSVKKLLENQSDDTKIINNELSYSVFNDCKTIIEQPDCAAYYQLLRVIDSGNKNKNLTSVYEKFDKIITDKKQIKVFEKEKIIFSKSIKEYIVYVDFSYIKKEHDDAIKEFIRNGFTVRFSEDGNPVKFAYFESSASMRKKCILSFVREDMKDDLLKRITLGMDPDRVNISKWFAYKGLAFSSGNRIPTAFLSDNNSSKKNDTVEFSEKTVAIVDDKTRFYTSTERMESITFSGNDISDLDLCFKLASDNQEYSYYLKNEKDHREYVNLFDGVGLISQEYAERLSCFLRGSNDRNTKYTSFQVRGPFIKGMLHSIRDVNSGESGFKFFFDQFGVKEITDIFGKPHKVSDIHFLIPRSMVKCASWLKKDNYSTFFKNAQFYKHALYVVQTNNGNNYSKGYTKLNYQVLSTLPLKEKDFNKILFNAYQIITKLNSDDDFLCKWIKSDFSNKIDTEEKNEALDDERRNDRESSESKPEDDEGNTNAPKTVTREGGGNNSYDKESEETEEVTEESAEQIEASVLGLIDKNKNFVRSPLFSNIRYNAVKKIIDDFAYGRIPIKGDKYYLSGTLLELLYALVPEDKKSFLDKKEADAYYEKSIHISPEKMYIPGNTRLKSKKVYGVFRNPHLSANEHVALSPFFPQKESLHYKLFGHLRNVCMISPTRFAAMKLSGADFDGDIVAVIEDETYNNAAKKAYDEGKVVIIPSPSGNNNRKVYLPDYDTSEKRIQAVRENEIDTLVATFRSFVGKYSNDTLKIVVDIPDSIIGKVKDLVEGLVGQDFSGIRYKAGDEYLYITASKTPDSFCLTWEKENERFEKTLNIKETIDYLVKDIHANDKEFLDTVEPIIENCSGGKGNNLQDTLMPIFDELKNTVKSEKENRENRVAAMTALVGLEIDSAKNGAKPELGEWLSPKKKDNSQPEKEEEDNTDYPNNAAEVFLKHKKNYNKYNEENVLLIEEKSLLSCADYTEKNRDALGNNVSSGRKKKRWEYIGYFPSTEEKTDIITRKSVIERLPYLYCWLRFESGIKKNPGLIDFKNNPLFSFEKAGWETNQDFNTLVYVSALVIAYKTAKANIERIYRTKEHNDTKEKYLYEILKLQFAYDEEVTPYKIECNRIVYELCKEFNTEELEFIQKNLFTVLKSKNEYVWQFYKNEAVVTNKNSSENGNKKIWDRLCNIIDHANESSHTKYPFLYDFYKKGFNVLPLLVALAETRKKNNLSYLNNDSVHKRKEDYYDRLVSRILKGININPYNEYIKRIYDESDIISQNKIIAAALDLDNDYINNEIEKTTLKCLIEEKEKEFLEDFSNVSTEYDVKSRSKEELRNRAVKIYKKFTKEEVLMTMYYLSPAIDREWITLSDLVSTKTIFEESIDLREKETKKRQKAKETEQF